MKINSINSIEVSSICDNKCLYCPAPTQSKHRSVGFMDMDTFKACIHWAKELDKRGSQREINLFGVGEPLLNPSFCDMAAYAREEMPNQRFHVNTNGNRLTKEIASCLRSDRIEVDITDHNALATARAIRVARSVGLTHGTNRDFVDNPNNWANQVTWFNPDYVFDCAWLNYGQVMVAWNGDIYNCCIDSCGISKSGNIKDDITQIDLKPFELCKCCHHIIRSGNAEENKTKDTNG